MALTVRPVSNVGDPLMNPHGDALAGVVIHFFLVDPRTRKPLDAWDAATGERVGGKYQATTDASGEFTINLWPNDRGNVQTLYLCRVESEGFRDFLGAVPSGVGTLTWVQFLSYGAPLTPAELSQLLTHIQDMNVHLTALENTFLDGLTLPTLTSAHVNYLIGVTGSVQGQLNTIFAALIVIAGGAPAQMQPFDNGLASLAASLGPGWIKQVTSESFVANATIPFGDISSTGDLADIAAMTPIGADRILFWDESVAEWRPLTVGTNLSITGNTLNATGTLVDGIAEAPGDGERYVRKDGGWVLLESPYVEIVDVIVDSSDGELPLHSNTWAITNLSPPFVFRAFLEGGVFNESGDGDHDIEFDVTLNGTTVLSTSAVFTLPAGTQRIELDLVGHYVEGAVRGTLLVTMHPISLGPTAGVTYAVKLDGAAGIGIGVTAAVTATVSGSDPDNNKIIINSSSFNVD